MGRHERRADVARMRQELSGASLMTWLVPADAKLAEPLLRRAVKFWRTCIPARRPFCPSCRANYADDAAEVGMFLLSTPATKPTAASVSAFCLSCSNTLSPDEIEHIAAVVLQRLIPGGRFLDDWDAKAARRP
jgi:hypothetical protein